MLHLANIAETRDLCLSETELIGFAEGRLSIEARAAASAHIDRCTHCFSLLAEAGRAASVGCDPIGETVISDDATPAGPADGEWTPPTIFGDYRLVETIGRGAAGQVWLARDTQLDRFVAIKFLTGPARAGARERFRLEARAIARLAHPNVVTVYSVGEVDDRPFLVSEFVSGKSLDKIAKPVPWPEALRIGLALAHGMAAAHRAGVLHRDIKPANAIITSGSGVVKLLDFGLAKLLEPGHLDAQMVATLDSAARKRAMPDESPLSLTASGAILGTPLYMAPEAWLGATTTARMDIYSLGAMLYELCHGRTPHAGLGFEELRRSVESADAEPLARHVPGIDRRFAEVIMRCLRRDPAERWATGEQLCEALEAITPPRVARPVPMDRPPAARPRRLALGLGAAVAVVGAVAGFAFWSGDGRTREPQHGAAAVIAPLDVNEAHDSFGAAVAVGDFDQDGHADLAVGVPMEELGGVRAAGAVDLFRGTPAGLVPWQRLTLPPLPAPREGTRFGAALAVGDLDGDGAADLAVGAPGHRRGDALDVGAVHIFHGGAIVNAWRVTAASSGAAGDAFGTTLAIGDLDGDGARDDLAVGAPRAGAAHEGRVYVLVSIDGKLVERAVLAGTALGVGRTGDRFGAGLGIGDLDGDGADDLVVAAPGLDFRGKELGSGRVLAFRQDAGRLVGWGELREISLDEQADTVNNSFGAAVAVADFDGDGRADVAVGAPTGGPGGRVYFFRGRAGAPPETWLRFMQHGRDEDGDFYGAVLHAGDLDRNGVADLMIGAILEQPMDASKPVSGEVYLIRGGPGVPEHWHDIIGATLAEQGNLDLFGAAIAAGDVDADGRADLLIGSPAYDTDGVEDAGSVFHFEVHTGAVPARRLLHQATGARD